MLQNTKNKYGLIARCFHWIMAFLMIAMLFMGNFFSIFPKEWNIFIIHKSIGILILLLVVLRLIWKLCSVKPEYSYNFPKWMRISAGLTHFILYLSMFSMPLSGWIMSKLEYPVPFFYLFTLPHLTSENDKFIRHLGHEVHEILPNILIALIVLHIGAALYHHFRLKDDTLRKML